MSFFYTKGKTVKAELDTALNAVVVHWNDLSNDNIIRECTAAQLEVIKEGAKTIIVDVAIARGMLSEQSQKYFESDLFPKLAEAGLRAIVTVRPKRELTLAAANTWTKTGEAFSFETFEADSLEAAKELAAKFA